MNKIHLTLIATVAMLGLHSCTPNEQGMTKTRAKTILLKVSGEVSAQPDEASITIFLECVDRDIMASKQCLIEKSEKLNESILKYGIKQEDILTTSIGQSKEYTWRNNSSVFVGYKSTMNTVVTARNMEALENLYTELLQNPNITINSLSYAHSKQDSLDHAAYQMALDKANALADKLLEKMDESEKEILRIGNVDLPAAPQDAYMYEEVQAESRTANVSAGHSRIRINSGNIFVSRTLMVEYRID